MSQERTEVAQKNGRFESEIVPVDVQSKAGKHIFLVLGIFPFFPN